MTTTRWLMAALHLIGFGIALGPIWARARALRGTLDHAGLSRVFVADNWWGVSAVVLIGTGMVRAFGGLEKGTSYYLGNHLFLTKMALVALVLALETVPMMALIRWRVAVRKGLLPDTHLARRYARISAVQAALIVAMVFLATGMARGLGSS
jgi:putative membrane protein